MFNILFSLFFIFQIYVISRFLRKREYTKATLYTIFSILFYIFVIWYTNYCEKVETFVLDTKIDGPNILIIAGTHGNESGPCVGLEELINLFVKNRELNKRILPFENDLKKFFKIFTSNLFSINWL